MREPRTLREMYEMDAAGVQAEPAKHTKSTYYVPAEVVSTWAKKETYRFNPYECAVVHKDTFEGKADMCKSYIEFVGSKPYPHNFVCSRPNGHEGNHEAAYTATIACCPPWEPWRALTANDTAPFPNAQITHCYTFDPSGYVCTREKGHDGPHQATVGDKLCCPLWEGPAKE